MHNLLSDFLRSLFSTFNLRATYTHRGCEEKDLFKQCIYPFSFMLIHTVGRPYLYPSHSFNKVPDDDYNEMRLCWMSNESSMLVCMSCCTANGNTVIHTEEFRKRRIHWAKWREKNIFNVYILLPKSTKHRWNVRNVVHRLPIPNGI